ncbi:hypothetical protein MJ560_26990 [Klebsiella pneumoniae]|nr:hypothetical protein MJ560_26990 [Klebsiella pneumoniae]
MENPYCELSRFLRKEIPISLYAFKHHRPDRVKNKQRSGGYMQTTSQFWSRIMSISLKKSGMLKLGLSLVATTVAASV